MDFGDKDCWFSRFYVAGGYMKITGEDSKCKIGENMVKGQSFTMTYKLRYENRLLS